MISVIAYGRNDSYGNNLQKRAALSLNCIAHVLAVPDDEILFVDYNTPDDLPTFPEAIRDTLTPRARALLRILRIRPHIHRRYASRTHLAVLEPVARNAALRRSNPANRWILSTNTDMILAPRNGRDLSTIAARLADGYYHLPRFELPQSLWEMLDRLAPAQAIAQAAKWGEDFGFNGTVRGPHDYFMYDGPGDFQLLLRADLLQIGGFDERILLGWHVDSNIARRLSLLRGPSGELTDAVQAYHCEHTRQATPKHLANRVEDDFATVVEGVETPWIDGENENSGLARETLEEIRLDGQEAGYLRALKSVIGTGDAARQHSPAFGKLSSGDGGDASRALPFVMDVLASYPRDLVLGWFGGRRSLLAEAAAAWLAMGFKEPIHVAGPAPWLGAELPRGAAWFASDEVVASAGVCVLDFGRSCGESLVGRGQTVAQEQVFVIRGLRALAAAEGRRVDNAIEAKVATQPCRVIAVESVNSRFEGLVKTYVGTTLSPVATRIRQGFIIPPQNGRRDILPAMTVGPAGLRAAGNGAVALVPGEIGFVCYGPYLDLLPGRYRLTLRIQDGALAAGKFPMTLEILSGDLWLAHRLVTPSVFAAGTVDFEFSVPSEVDDAQSTIRIQARLRTDGRASGTLSGAVLERVPGAPERLPMVSEWLPLLSVGVGKWSRVGWRNSERIVSARGGHAGHVVFGPFCGLLPGRYEVEFTLAVRRRRMLPPVPIRLDVIAGSRCLASRPVQPATIGRTVWGLPIIIRPNLADSDGRMGLEFRVWTDGSLGLSVLSVRTRRLTPYAVP